MDMSKRSDASSLVAGRIDITPRRKCGRKETRTCKEIMIWISLSLSLSYHSFSLSFDHITIIAGQCKSYHLNQVEINFTILEQKNYKLAKLWHGLVPITVFYLTESALFFLQRYTCKRTCLHSTHTPSLSCFFFPHSHTIGLLGRIFLLLFQLLHLITAGPQWRIEACWKPTVERRKVLLIASYDGLSEEEDENRWLLDQFITQTCMFPCCMSSGTIVSFKQSHFSLYQLFTG